MTVWPLISWSAIVFAWSIGMAKPTPMLPVWPVAAGSEAMAVLMPMTRPARRRAGRRSCRG